MAFLAYAQLTLNGTSLDGDVRNDEMGGVDLSSGHLELVEFSFGVSSPTQRSGLAAVSGRREYSPLVFRKQMDRATPLLYQALVTNQAVAGGVKLFDTSLVDGTMQHRFTFSFDRARVTAIEDASPSVFENPEVPLVERVTLLLADFTVTDHVNGVVFEDQIAQR